MRFSPAVPRQAAQLALARAFAAAGLATPSLDARVLLCEALGTDHAGLIRDGEAELGAAAARLAGFAERRLAGEPVGRILGRRDFFALSFRLGPDTLEPRPDSETLVEAARDLLVAREAGPLRLLDLGTGTGAILAALLSVFPGAFGIGVDRAFGACRVAADNLRDLGLSARGVLFCGDWAEALGEPFDLVVSNPPYVASREVAALPRTVPAGSGMPLTIAARCADDRRARRRGTRGCRDRPAAPWTAPISSASAMPRQAIRSGPAQRAEWPRTITSVRTISMPEETLTRVENRSMSRPIAASSRRSAGTSPSASAAPSAAADRERAMARLVSVVTTVAPRRPCGLDAGHREARRLHLDEARLLGMQAGRGQRRRDGCRCRPQMDHAPHGFGRDLGREGGADGQRRPGERACPGGNAGEDHDMGAEHALGAARQYARHTVEGLRGRDSQTLSPAAASGSG